MLKPFIFIVSFLLLFFSCTNKKGANYEHRVFVQPKVLEKNAQFHIDSLSFKEHFKLLFSKALDTINNNYSLNNIEAAQYPSNEKIEREENENYKRFAHIPEKRYFFESFTLDSLATVNNIYFNKINIETDKNLNIKTLLAYTNFYNTKALDSALHKLYLKYGLTTDMKEQKRIDIEHDSLRGKSSSNSKNYEKPLYHYGQEGYINTGKYHYHQWILKDRVLQIKIYAGRDMEVDLTTEGEMKITDYHTLEFLSIKKEEYNRIKAILFENMETLEHEVEILKPYKIKTLSYENAYYKFIDEMDKVKEAEMEAQYLKPLEND
jgi:hypothetical protein